MRPEREEGVIGAVKQSFLQHGLTLVVAALVPASCIQAQMAHRSDGLLAASMITGIVRDANGVPQMGALVQALLPDATLGGSAITDSRGQYHFYIQPGSYRIRATAALLLPAVREHLLVSHGSRAVVDLTLTTLLAPDGWLPVSRRTVNEPSDDWTWTLRSASSRSILRLADSSESNSNEAGSGPLVVSSSSQEARHGISSGRVTLKDSDGAFARGGSHNIIVLTRVDENGRGAVLRSDLSGTRSPYPVAPSAEISVGLQRRTPLNGFSRAVLTYSSHPELTAGRGVTGMQGATLRSAQRIDVGDLLRIDAGSVMRDSNLGGNALIVEPFLRVAAHAGDGVVLAYSMTRSRGTESLDDLDRVQAATPVAILRNGHLQLENGSHHAISMLGKLHGGGSLEAVLYRDQMRNPFIAGTGTLTASDMQANAAVADPTTHSYRVAAHDYSSAGARLTVRQPLTKSLQAGAEITVGEALRTGRLHDATLADVLNRLAPARVYAATAFADGKILRTGTTLRASFRWQPERTLTAVDAFHIGDDGAYLSCSMRQSLGKAHFLPQGLEAVIDLQNLLAQGYQPFVSNDGQTLYLAQTPRSVQAGISFSF